MRSRVALALLLCSCAIGSAGFDDQGNPEVIGVAVLQKIEACAPEGDQCARMGSDGISANAASIVRSPGILGFLKSTGWSIVKWGAGLLF